MALQALLGIAQAQLSTNEAVASTARYTRTAPANSGDGEVHMLIVALDYKRTSNPLTCSMDARNMEALARACGISDVTAMYDEQCSKERVLEAIGSVCERCTGDDYLVIYYSGHGTSVEDEDGDEDDGQDEAFCFVDSQGQVTCDTLLTDDEFAEALIEATDEEARIVILTDCCHSGTIADLDKEEWAGREAISITGCMDSETSGDMGKGGIFTHSMLLAIDQLEDAGESDYSVGMLYNATLENDNKVFNSAQNITIQSTASCSPDRIAWPLVPKCDYKAPLTQAMAAGGGGANGGSAGGLPPHVLEQLGIKPQMAQFINESGLQGGKVDPKRLLKAGLDCYMSGGCKKDACALM